MLLQIFAAWPLPAGPAWTIVRPIAARTGWARAKTVGLAADHEGERRRLGAATPPETGASSMSNPASAAAAATARAVSTSIVEQSISSAPLRACASTPVGAEIDRAHLRPGGQHRDDDLARAAAAAAACGGVPPCCRQSRGRARHQVEAGHPMPGLDQVGRHRPTHIAEPDKADRRHCLPPGYSAGACCLPIILATSGRPTSAKNIGAVQLAARLLLRGESSWRQTGEENRSSAKE